MISYQSLLLSTIILNDKMMSVCVFSDDEEMMNAEDVKDEVADDEHPSGSSRTDQNLIRESHSLVSKSSVVCK